MWLLALRNVALSVLKEGGQYLKGGAVPQYIALVRTLMTNGGEASSIQTELHAACHDSNLPYVQYWSILDVKESFVQFD